jgi:hypothetical protein
MPAGWPPPPAYGLTAFPRGDQPRLAGTIIRHGLRTREADAFLTAWPPVADPAERREARTVQKDGAIPVDDSYYPAPGPPDGQQVRVHVDSRPRADLRRRRRPRRHAPGTPSAQAAAGRGRAPRAA